MSLVTDGDIHVLTSPGRMTVTRGHQKVSGDGGGPGEVTRPVTIAARTRDHCNATGGRLSVVGVFGVETETRRNAATTQLSL